MACVIEVQSDRGRRVNFRTADNPRVHHFGEHNASGRRNDVGSVSDSVRSTQPPLRTLVWLGLLRYDGCLRKAGRGT
jgi:hypothetical protein